MLLNTLISNCAFFINFPPRTRRSPRWTITMVENIFVESSGSKQFALLLSASQREEFIANLSSGQLLEGKVVRVLSDYTFLVNFKGDRKRSCRERV